MKLSPNSFTEQPTVKWLLALALGLLFILIVLPLSASLIELFLVGGEFSFQNFSVVLFSARQWSLFSNSMLVSCGSALLAWALGVPFAYFVQRTNLPGKFWFKFFGLFPLFIPPLITTIAWSGELDIQGPLWALFIFACSYFPFVWLLTARALERIDQKMEDAARMSGGFGAVLRIHRPYVLASSAMGALFVFVFVLADFSVPDYLSAIGTKFNVYADDIFFRWKQENRTGEAIAAALPPVVLISLALWLILKLRKKLPPTIGSQFQAPKSWKLGSWKLAGILFCLGILILSVFIPLGFLLKGAGGIAPFQEALDTARYDLLNSLGIALATGFFAVLVQMLPAYFTARKPKLSWMEPFILIPLALPAMLLAIGLIRTWNHSGPLIDWSEWIYGTKVVVIMAFVTRFSFFSFFAANEGARSIHPHLEEAGQISGLPPMQRFRYILFPLWRPALLTGAIFVFLFSMREIDGVALIPAGNPTVMFRIYNYVHFGRDNLIAALCLTTIFFIALPVLVFTLMQRNGEDRRS